jgi:hypothetical protein
LSLKYIGYFELNLIFGVKITEYNPIIIMAYRIVTFVVLFIFFSCSHRSNSSGFVSEKVAMEQVSLTTQLPTFHVSQTNISEMNGLDNLMLIRDRFLEESTVSNLDELKTNWEKVRLENDFEHANSKDLSNWFEVAGLLLERTGEANFASELEKIVFSGIGNTREENENLVAPYVFTKNTDDLFVNLITPSVINYNHTTKGKVRVELETNFPQSGKVDLKFGMTKRRYIEVNIRIPDWAEGATVTVKKVRYFAPPGGYCKIAKKWKEGDLIEVNFPIEKVPGYLQL